MLDVNSRVDDKSAKGEEETQCNEGESPACVIRGEAENEQHSCASDVGCHRVEVGFDGTVALYRDRQ